MKRLTISIVLLIVAILMSGTLFSQERSNEVPVRRSGDVPVRRSNEVPVRKSSEVPVKGSNEISVKGSSEIPVRRSRDVPVRRSRDVPVRRSSEVPVRRSNEVAVRSIKEVPVKGSSSQTISAATDTIEVGSGESGWHVIHKKAPNRLLNEGVLRTIDVCVQCHVTDEYKIFDPHKQRSDKGKIFGKKCLYCHAVNPIDFGAPITSGSGWHVIHKEAPKKVLGNGLVLNVCSKCHVNDEKRATAKEIKGVENPTLLCQGCHGKKYTPAHPADAGHLIKPSPKLLGWMKEGEKKLDIVFRVDPEGKITCITCHNPHDKGIIPSGMMGAEGAGEKFGNRMPNQKCTACHKDK